MCCVPGERGGSRSPPASPVAAGGVSGAGPQRSLGWVSAAVTLRHVLGPFET